MEMMMPLLHRLQVLFLSLLFSVCDSSMFSMLSHDQRFIVDTGGQLSLRCEFYKPQFNLFDNPVQWKKSQYGEESEINIMGNIKDPFDSTGRFQVTYDDKQPRYTLGLLIKNMSRVDTGNYTCEVHGPKSAELGSVRYTVFVRAPVTEMLIAQGNSTLSEDSSGLQTITFVENEPTAVRCITRGGSPPPELEVSVGREDITKYFRFDSAPTISGEVGFRTLQITAMLVTDDFTATARDDGKHFKCKAQVPGLTPEINVARIAVHYAPRIECVPKTASVGLKNEHLTCHVTSHPPVTKWFWIIDNNGTKISEGEVLNDFWTVAAPVDGMLRLQLYIRQTKEETFHHYTVVVANSVGVRRENIYLKKRYKDAESKPQSRERASHHNKTPAARANRNPYVFTSGCARLNGFEIISVIAVLCVTFVKLAWTH